MDTFIWFLWLLSIALILFLGWHTFHSFVALMYPDRKRYRFVDSPESKAAILRSEKGRALLENIESLGFSFLGIKTEQRLLSSPVPEIALASREMQAFASIARVQRTLIYYFYTPFADGSLVFTANAGFREVETGDCSIKNMSWHDPGELLADHRRRTQEFKDRGLIPFEEYTRETRIEATYLFYTSASARRAMYPTLVRRILLIGLIASFNVVFCMSMGLVFLGNFLGD